jgi:hypothetical protein
MGARRATELLDTDIDSVLQFYLCKQVYGMERHVSDL